MQDALNYSFLSELWRKRERDVKFRRSLGDVLPAHCSDAERLIEIYD